MSVQLPRKIADLIRPDAPAADARNALGLGPGTYISPSGDGSLLTATAGRPGELARDLATRAADTYNIKDFGADPTGMSDSTSSIQAAMNAAVAAGGGTVLFPPGIYLVGSYSPSSPANNAYRYQLGVTTTTSIPLAFSGPGATIQSNQSINSYGSGVALFDLAGPFSALTFDRLSFVNTHGAIKGATQAIVVDGGSSSSCLGLKIDGCTFSNWSEEITLSGCVAPEVTRNQFFAPHGRDSATTTTRPAVSIWLDPGANVPGNSHPVYHALIADNYFDGASGGPVASNTDTSGDGSGFGNNNKVGKDGMCYGQSAGWQVVRNRIKHHGYEAIVCQARDSTTLYPCLVASNAIDSTLASGSVPYGNYSMRVEESGATITDNVITGGSYGILIDGSAYPTYNGGAGLTVSGTTISNNRFAMSGLVGSTNSVAIGLSHCSGIKLDGNRATWVSIGPPAFGLSLFTCDSIDVKHESYGAAALSGGNPLVGITMQDCTNISLAANSLAWCNVGINFVESGTPCTVTERDTAFTGCAMNLAPDGVSYHTSAFNRQRQIVSFVTPTTGWYRIATFGFRGDCTLAIQCVGTNSSLDALLFINAGSFGVAGSVTQVRGATMPNPTVDQVRTSSDGSSGTCFVDIHVAIAEPANPIFLTLDSGQVPGVFLVGFPTPNPTPGASAAVLTMGPGLRSTGTVAAGTSVAIGSNSITFATTVPSAGSHAAGDVAYNSAPTVGQPQGWICTAAGQPGNWVAMAKL